MSRLARSFAFSLLTIAIALASLTPRAAASSQAAEEIVIFGATPAGIVAAVTAVRMGARPLLVTDRKHIGGMVTGGLSATDEGINRLIGGTSREIFRRIGWRYGKSVEWNFEPHVATAVFHALLREAELEVKTSFELARVEKDGPRITALVSASGERVDGKVFVDATYEGDLMAAAGVSFSIGRESQADYGESLAGFRPDISVDQFLAPVLGTDRDGARLPGVAIEPTTAAGGADGEIMAFNYRLCVTDDVSRRIPFPAPPALDERHYEILFRYFEALPTLALQHLFNFLPVQNGKYDLNNRGPFSTDVIGGGRRYVDGPAAERRSAERAHYDYTVGLWHVLQHHPRVPLLVRNEALRWGLCADEFRETNGWPPQLYVREARRLRGRFVMTERDVRADTEKRTSIGMGSKPVESHHVQRYVLPDGTVKNEGFIYPRSEGQRPYEIPYESLLPLEAEAENLIVPVCLSATHIAYSSIRMEPVYMILGQSAGAASVLAMGHRGRFSEVPYETLRARLLAQGQVLQDPKLKGKSRPLTDPHRTSK